ncbi:MAG: dephospho-CoA kinase [Actinobacteria bacterium]|jgi:dephospho-CoA kinase|nr:dephospho-CoA kinase [Actinomycetota bacterium]MCL6105112.1 dephospho-CoA kinase [Actinomycetota bacterium]
MLTIGLTGGIGSGKSTVGTMLVDKGAFLLDADQIAKEVVLVGKPAYKKIVKRFGTTILTKDGSLDREALAEVVFSDSDALADLNSITHPQIGKEILQRLSKLAAEESTAKDAHLGEALDKERIVLLDIPLLAESKDIGTGRFFEGKEGGLLGTIVVDAPEEVCSKRLIEKRGMNPSDVALRMRSQASRETRAQIADFIIDNSGTLQDLKKQVDMAWEWISGLLVSKRNWTV